MDSEPGARSESERLRERLQASLGDRYAVGPRLGSGGTGSVFSAEDRKHDRSVAIKVLRPELAERVGAARFLREIRFAARLSHPHLVPLYDSGDAGGLLYYVMPVMEGESLRSILDREGPLPIERALGIAREIADALAHAHARGIVHRDVKPGNILLSGGHALLADFGIARAVEAAQEDRLTQAGLAVGTPGYMSPEQLSADVPIDERSDIYGLACVLFEMLGGRPPFGTGSMASVYASQVHGAPPRIQSIRPEVPDPLAEILDRALALRPADRFHDITGFQDALADCVRPARDRRAVVVGTLLAVALVGALALPPLLESDDLSDQAGSVMVVPFGDAIQSKEEATLAIDLADELTRQFNRWDSVRAVPQISLAGVRFDLGIEEPVLRRPEDGLRAARAVGVENLVALSVRIRGDSADVTATRFSTRRGRPVGRPIESRGPTDDPFRLAAAITHQVLGLSGTIDQVERLRRQSSNAQALIDYERGLDFLGRWRLSEAETHLRRAVALDSTFAMAHHYLALTLYWQGAGRTDGLLRLGPEAARASRAALRHSKDLPSKERDHVGALNRFLEGDYARARSRYSELLQRDSTDVFAWLLQGIVEFTDPWLVPGPDGALHPRSDLAVAARSFAETTRLSPGFHLGYGHLFDITGMVLGAATSGTLVGRERPRDEIILPWHGASDPEYLEAFAPVLLDSLVWMDETRFREATPSTFRAGALDLLESSMRTLRRWSAFAPEEPRPHSELATWTIRQYQVLEPPQPPQRTDSLARVALEHAERALALSADTLPDDHVRRANLVLASGDLGRARSIALTAVETMEPGATLDNSVSNPFLATGDWRTALALLDRESARRIFWSDPNSDDMLHDGGAQGLASRLRILAAAGASDAGLSATLDEWEARLERGGDGMADPRMIREHYTPRLALALASRPSALRAWIEGTDLSDPIWRALDPEVPDRRDAIRRSLTAAEPEVSEPTRSYLLGSAALEAGDARLALRLLSRVDSIPNSLESRDPGWGVEPLAWFRRAQAHDALGDSARATDLYERFLATRLGQNDDAPFTVAARDRLERRSGGG